MIRLRSVLCCIVLAFLTLARSASAQAPLTTLCACDRLPATVRIGGAIDNYALPTDAVVRGPELNAAFPNAIWKLFDDSAINRFVGFTFRDLPGDIVCAKLEIHLRPGGFADNDVLYLGLLSNPVGQFAWATPLKELPGTGGGWSTPLDPGVFTLDLGALPLSSSSPAKSILAQLNADHRLDLLVQDDTTFDWVRLTLRTFAESVVTVGLADNFALPTEATSRGAQLNAAFPTAAWKDLDDASTDRFVGHTFGSLPANIVQASLEMRLQPLAGQPGNDSVNLGLNAGSTFAFSSSVFNLPGAGGSWSNNPATTFQLDLAVLPNNSSLLSKINLDHRLDFLLQDDSKADYLRLRYRVCPAPRRFSGIDFTNLGVGQLEPSSAGTLLASGFTATGEDGFGLALEGGQGVCVGLTNVCPSGWGQGTALQLTAQGPFTEPDHLGDLTFALSGSSVQVAGDFSPNPAPCTWVQICNDEQMVASACIEGTSLFSLGSSTCIKEVDYLKVNDQSSGFSVLLDGPTLVQVNGGPQATGNRVKVYPDFLVGEHRKGLGRLSVRGRSIPNFEVTGTAVQAFGRLVMPLGSAALLPAPESLTASQLGTGGRDGLSVKLGAVEAASVSLAPIDPGKSAPVGSYLEAEVFGTIASQPGQSLGRLRFTQGAAAARPFEVDADFSNISSPTHRVQLFDGDRLVIDQPGLSGPAALTSSWPNRIGKLGGQTECFTTRFPNGTSFSIDGRVFSGNELRILAETSVDLGAKSELQLRATGIPEITLTDITSGAPASCTPSATKLCLSGGRFAVEAEFHTDAGARGQAPAIALTPDTGYFYFFGPTNVELIVKALNGCGVNGHFWLFSAGLTNVEVDLKVTDTVTGDVRHYLNPLGTAYPPKLDTSAFATCPVGNLAAPGSAGSAPPAPEEIGQGLFKDLLRLNAGSDLPLPSKAVSAAELPLRNGRFRVTATYRTPQGQSGAAQAVSLTDDTGYFWFFNAENVESVVKVLDACTLNSRFWFFAAGLTNVEVSITVTDTQTGTARTYINPQGTSFAPIQDTSALATCP